MSQVTTTLFIYTQKPGKQMDKVFYKQMNVMYESMCCCLESSWFCILKMPFLSFCRILHPVMLLVNINIIFCTGTGMFKLFVWLVGVFVVVCVCFCWVVFFAIDIFTLPNVGFQISTPTTSRTFMY